MMTLSVPERDMEPLSRDIPKPVPEKLTALTEHRECPICGGVGFEIAYRETVSALFKTDGNMVDRVTDRHSRVIENVRCWDCGQAVEESAVEEWEI